MGLKPHSTFSQGTNRQNQTFLILNFTIFFTFSFYYFFGDTSSKQNSPTDLWQGIVALNTVLLDVPTLDIPVLLRKRDQNDWGKNDGRTDVSSKWFAEVLMLVKEYEIIE